MFSNVPAQFLKDILILIQLKKKKEKLSTDFNFMTLILLVYDSLANILSSHKESYMTGLNQLSPCNMKKFSVAKAIREMVLGIVILILPLLLIKERVLLWLF